MINVLLIQPSAITLKTEEPHNYKEGQTVLVFDDFTAVNHRIVGVARDRRSIVVEPL